MAAYYGFAYRNSVISKFELLQKKTRQKTHRLTHQTSIVEDIYEVKSILAAGQACITHLPRRSTFFWYITSYCSLDRFNDEEILSTNQKEKQIDRLSPWIVREKLIIESFKFQMHYLECKNKGNQQLPPLIGVWAFDQLLINKNGLASIQHNCGDCLNQVRNPSNPIWKNLLWKGIVKPLIWKHSNEDSEERKREVEPFHLFHSCGNVHCSQPKQLEYSTPTRYRI